MARNQAQDGESKPRRPLWFFVQDDFRELRAPSKVVAHPDPVDSGDQRNSPCVCGSGKKYKLCHGRKRGRFLRRAK